MSTKGKQPLKEVKKPEPQKSFSEQVKEEIKSKSEEVTIEVTQEFIDMNPDIKGTLEVGEIISYEKEAPKVKSESKVSKKVVKDPVMDFEIDADQVYEFQLQRRLEAKHNIPTEARTWCEATKSVRDIRYCRTEASPYVDEQSEDARVERELIKFSSKSLLVSGREEAKIRYLLAYDANGDKEEVLPQNISNKNLYKLRDKEVENVSAVSEAELELSAGLVIKEADLEELKNFMRSRFNVVTESEAELKSVDYAKAKIAPAVFTTDFTNPKHKIKATLQKALEAKVLVVEGSDIKYGSTGALVKAFNPAKYTFDEDLARWVIDGSKEAKDFLSVVEGKI